ncbi:MAG: integration host factor subunit alpha [Gammaproteobacteria bacterium RIFCSPHIGHO2_12_FULL_41_20]|nr:MAG: integration host factor subunit alpha [Gammaproteobacteria bacterium RIFCSPHIGHO2_12_FULL_41_20]
MTLTKADIAERLFQEVGITKRDANEMIELFYHYISAALEQGKPVKLSGFGNFELHDKNERPGRNPRTGEAVPVSARRVVTFRCGQKLKARVEKYAGKESKEHILKEKE